MIVFDQPIKLLILWVLLAESQCHITSEGSISDGDCGLYDEKQANDTGKYPWEAILLNKTDKGEWEYFCDGVLINSNTIVTAASCIQPKNSNHRIALTNIKVELGDVYDKNFEISETHKRKFSISGYLIHSGWDSYQTRYSHDFAMLKLDDETEKIKDFLRSVCFKHSKEISDMKLGSMNGFNGTNLTIIDDKVLYADKDNSFNFSNDYYETTTIENTASNFDESILNRETVGALDTNDPEIMESIDELKKLAQLKGQESFIAGANSTGICPAKIGSGFYVEFQGKIFLKGIVSSTGREENFDCTQSGNVMFSDTLKYFMPEDKTQFDSPKKNHYIKYSEAKLLKREPICRDNDDELECSLELTSFITRCTNDTNIWDQLNGQQLSSLNVTIDGKSEFCTQYFTQVTSLKKLALNKKKSTPANVAVDVDKLIKILTSLKQLKEFKIERVTMAALQGSLFHNKQKLEKIYFKNNELTTLSKTFLEGFEMLKEFTFAKNLIETVPVELFSANQNLEKIDISSNQIPMLPDGLLQNNNLLKSFNVRENRLTSVPEFLFSKNVQLEMIDLSENPIKSLPERFLDNMNFLKVFNFEQSDEGYYEFSDSTDYLMIPEKFFNDTLALEEINMSLCNIKELPVGLLKNLEKLKVVDFTQNKINFIHEHFFLNNKNLEVIFLVKNKIKKLPDDFLNNFPLLKLFDVRQNLIESIAEDFFTSNVNLEGIDLSENPIEFLPNRLFEKLDSLKVLYLENLSLNSISADIISNNKKLEYVNLSGNEIITTVLEHVLFNNVELQELDMSSCGIEQLPEEFLKRLIVLKKVNLSENRISKIPENFFSNNELLETIDFGDNEINEVPKTLLNGLKSLQRFYLNANGMGIIIPENYFTENADKAGRIFFIGQPYPKIDPILVRSLLG